MKNPVLNFIIIAMLIFPMQALRAGAPDNAFGKACEAYSRGDYATATGLFEDIVDAGNADDAVYYNLGNSYFREGNYPYAILNYERARKLNPGDEDILFNLRIANLKIVDKIEPLTKPFFVSWGESARDSFPASAWARIAIALLWLSVGLFAGFIYSRRSMARKIFFFSSAAVLVVFSLCFFTAYKADRALNDRSDAIVTSPSVYAKNSPDPASMDIFILHEGTKVRVLDGLKGWQKVRLENGAVGWLPGRSVVRI